MLLQTLGQRGAELSGKPGQMGGPMRPDAFICHVAYDHVTSGHIRIRHSPTDLSFQLRPPMCNRYRHCVAKFVVSPHT